MYPHTLLFGVLPEQINKMCKAGRQHLRLKDYLCRIAKYSVIRYLNNKHEKDCPFIPYHFGCCSGIYILRTFQKRLPYYQSEILQAVALPNKTAAGLLYW